MDNKRLDDIEKKLDDILSIVKTNEEDCKKMSDHIDFIENIIRRYNPFGIINSITFKR